MWKCKSPRKFWKSGLAFRKEPDTWQVIRGNKLGTKISKTFLFGTKIVKQHLYHSFKVSKFFWTIKFV